MEQINDEKNFDFVVPKDDGYIHLSCLTNFYELKHYPFNGGSHNRVLGSPKADAIIFTTDNNNNELTWIGDLADLDIQKRVSNLVGNINRIGVDEVEWQRRRQ